MSDRASERLFVALAIATVAILSVIGNGSTSQRFADALVNAITTNIALLLLIRIGIFASAIMFFVNSVVLRMRAPPGLRWRGSAHASRVGAPVRVE
jgi:hypothetical protein